MARLQNKVAIITGAASGMGLAAAGLFAREGATVVMTDVVAEALEREAESIRSTGGSAVGIVLDVSSANSWTDVVQHVLAEHHRIDILVNNAGIHIPKGILEAELDDWNRVLAVNATGVWLGMKSVIPAMREQGGGSIINVSSIAALVGGQGDGGGAAYSASKGAVRALTKHAAQWFASDSIRVNSVHPGAVYTGMAAAAGYDKDTMGAGLAAEVPLPPHVGDPLDIAYGMLYLASDESKYVTAEELVIDGGWITH